MSIEDAQTLPLNWHRKLTVTKVNEIKKHGLTLSSAAVVLDTSAANLSNFLKRHNIEWPSKGICYKAGITDQYSTRQKILNSDVKQITVYMWMRRKGLRADEAIDYQNNYWTEAETVFLVDNYLLLKYKQLSQVLGKSELSVKSKIKKMGLKKRTKK